MSALSICIVLRTFAVVISMCLLYVSLGSRVSPSMFGLMFMGSVMLSICSASCVMLSICSASCVLYYDRSGVNKSASCFVWIEKLRC